MQQIKLTKQSEVTNFNRIERDQHKLSVRFPLG